VPPIQTSVDWTNLFLALGLLSLLVGIALERWWALLLPLVALPTARSLFVLASLDDRYRRAAPASGAPIGGEGWASFAAVALATTVPAVVAGFLLVAIGRRLGRRSSSRTSH
jgi:ABC-type spermidine/putrescine transport system permease subunit I